MTDGFLCGLCKQVHPTKAAVEACFASLHSIPADVVADASYYGVDPEAFAEAVAERPDVDRSEIAAALAVLS